MRHLGSQPGLGPLSLARVLALLFFLSGFCGLCYQIVWLRKAFAAFGIITPVLSVVVSVFMAGLAIGSFAGGRLAERFVARSGRSPLVLYALAETLIACGAFLVPRLFALGETLLSTEGASDGAGYLTRSALIIAGSILPWCVAMGTTFPFMMAFVRGVADEERTSFSLLYLANTIGAMVGALATALVLVELLGFAATLRLAAATNLFVAGTSLWLARRSRGSVSAVDVPAAPPATDRGAHEDLALWLLFWTGLMSMGMEVVWTRAFTPVLRTTIYAFASILAAYLLATWLGSALYRRHLSRTRVVATPWLVLGCAAGGLLPLLLNDPRLAPGPLQAVASIFPLCFALGYLTPRLVDGYSQGDPTRAGRAYALNVIGSLLGPLLAGYALLPLLGVKASLLLLGLPLIALACWLPFREPGRPAGAALGGLAALSLLALAALAIAETHEEQYARNGIVRRDHTATVVSTADLLLVNGIGITHRTTITKWMAHLPLLALGEPAERSLVICFGMGTTFRSLASWGVDVTAVELVPSVRQAFGDYFPDAGRLLASDRARVVVDDGRRFLKRTPGRYDVITLDPPPPVEASGSGLLYSKEFYAAALERLSDRGILHQWLPGGPPRTVGAVTQSLVESFPHVRAFRSLEGWGVHYLASRHPIALPSPAELASRLPARARQDLGEWSALAPEAMLQSITRNEFAIAGLLRAGEGLAITDDRPRNEYYLLGRSLDWLRR